MAGWASIGMSWYASSGGLPIRNLLRITVICMNRASITESLLIDLLDNNLHPLGFGLKGQFDACPPRIPQCAHCGSRTVASSLIVKFPMCVNLRAQRSEEPQVQLLSVGIKSREGFMIKSTFEVEEVVRGGVLAET